jgi:hypothetical protein
MQARGQLSETIAVRFEGETLQRISAIAERSFRTPSALVRDWVLERLATFPGEIDIPTPPPQSRWLRRPRAA